jgi:hypothetical protein
MKRSAQGIATITASLDQEKVGSELRLREGFAQIDECDPPTWGAVGVHLGAQWKLHRGYAARAPRLGAYSPS